METDLVELIKTLPWSGQVCAWTSGGRRIDAFCNREQDIAAVGAVWTVRHVADAARVVFEKTPPTDACGVEVFDGHTWRPWREDLAVRSVGHAWEITFAPVATDQLRVSVPVETPPKELSVHRFMAGNDPATWPASVTTGELATRILARDGEPSFEDLCLHGLSMPNWASTGLKDSPCEQGVAWDGEIHCLDRRIRLALGETPVRLADVRDTVRRSLLDGWLPAVVVEGRIGAMAIRQTSFAVYTDRLNEGRPAMFVSMELTNTGTSPLAEPLRIEVRDAPADPYEGTLGTEIFLPERDLTPSEWTLEERVLIRNGRPYLASSETFRAQKGSSTLVFDVALAPGASQRCVLAVPLPPWNPSVAQARELAGLPFDAMPANLRAYWDAILKSAMRLNLPEPRLHNLHRAMLAQVFINADGDIMPYGAAPSNYDGSVYGVEESYAMRFLAMSGFGADAQRYMSATYLRPAFLAKAKVFQRVEDRNQQNKNGLTPAGAIELYRFSRDLDWIKKHLPLLKECAEWTIANRCRQMTEDGRRPIHYGLLPMWAFSGDIHEPCHPLYPNFACWRGLVDTARLMAEIGDEESAERYRAEANDFRDTLLGVVDVLTRRDAEPPFLPLETAATEPSHGDFYQLFGSLLMDLLPFDYSDPRSRYIGDYLDSDNRLFCGLPRVRRTIGAGGIDAIYGLGHIMSLLHQDRIREFLLAVYAYQVFNMEHTCFTSRESNRIFSSDLHVWTPHPHSDWSGPLTCSSAVGALLVRHMVVTEETRGAAEYTGSLLILYGAPRRWYEPGNRITVENAVTHYGVISFEVETAADRQCIRAKVTLHPRAACTSVKIRLRHPDGRPMRSVSVNGAPLQTFEAADELVEAPRRCGTFLIAAMY